MSKIMNELTEAATTRAMSIAELVEWHQSRARCCRCAHYDADIQSCGTAMLRGIRIVKASEFGCSMWEEAV